MVFVYLLITALVGGIIFSVASFLLENLLAVIFVVAAAVGAIWMFITLRAKVKKAKRRHANKVHNKAVSAAAEKHAGFQTIDDLPEDEEVLFKLRRQCLNSGDYVRAFTIAQKIYQVTGKGMLLALCYFEGQGTEKDIQKGRELQKAFMLLRMQENGGCEAPEEWKNWWGSRNRYFDLNGMLDVARELCRKKLPVDLAMMEDVQLALASGLDEKTLADRKWRERPGFEPYSMFDNEENWKKNKLLEESEDACEPVVYAAGKGCWFALQRVMSDGRYKEQREEYRPIFEKICAEVEERLKDPEKVEREARARAEKIWAAVRIFETGATAGNIDRVKKAMADGFEAAEIFYLRQQAHRGDPMAYFKLAELYRGGEGIFHTARSKNALERSSDELEAKGAKRYAALAAQGNADAQYHHAIHLEKGLYAVDANPAKAMDSYRKAAAQNHPAACARLTRMAGSEITFAEAEGYAQRIFDTCMQADTFEKRSALRSAWAFQIRQKISDQWSILRKTQSHYRPDNSTDACFELAKKYVLSEAEDMRLGNIEVSESYLHQAEAVEKDDWDAAYKLAHTYAWRIHFEGLRDCSYRDFYTDGDRAKALQEHKDEIYENDLICGALMQYCAAQRWEAANAGNIDAIADLHALYHIHSSSVTKFFLLDEAHWYDEALRTGTARGYYIAGAYGGNDHESNLRYLRKALEMGYTKALEAIRSEQALMREEAKARAIENTPSSWRSYRPEGSDPSAGEAQERADRDSLQTVLNIPDVIHGPYNKIYTRMSISSSSAVYWCDETGESTTIHNSDISGMHATTAEGRFWW